MSLRNEKYIPYKFVDSKENSETIVFCREIESGFFKQFSLPAGKWIIVDPFRYENETIDEIKLSLKKIFQTSSVYYEPDWDRFVISDYDSTNYDENNFKSSLVLPKNYRSKIVMNKKRFYNLFSSDGQWLNERGSGYFGMEKNHIFIYQSVDKSWYSRTAIDPLNEWKAIDGGSIDLFFKDTDIIFSSTPVEVFEKAFNIHIPIKVDYIYLKASVFTEDRSNHENPFFNEKIDEWYNNNIRSLYTVSFLSSRNLSEIFLQTEKEWKELADDISLGLDPSLYKGQKITRFHRNFSNRGKYNKVYFYRMGDIMLALMNRSLVPRTKVLADNLMGVSFLSEAIWNFFALENLDPEKFLLPNSAVYMDKQFLVTSKQLDGIGEPYYSYDYMVVIGDGSYIVFDKNIDKTIFYGSHQLCNPIFPAVKKCIEKYIICKAHDYEAKIDAICRLTEKDEISLRSNIEVTKRNMIDYQNYLSSTEREKLNRNENVMLSLWLISEEKLISHFDKTKVTSGSTDYIHTILQRLDRI